MRFLVLLIVFVNFVSLADSFRPEGEHFQPASKVEIVWASTNELPKGLWTYKVVPQEIPMAAISNLMFALDFKWNNLTKFSDPQIKDKNLIFFADKKTGWNRFLKIAPTLGRVEYYEPSENEIDTNGVPNASELERLANEILFELGIDRSSLTDEHIGYESIRGKLSKYGQRLTTNLVSRGISFNRKVDVSRFGGMPCFMAIFESHERLQSLTVSWPKIQPKQAFFTLTSDEIINGIKGGETVFPKQFCEMSDMENAKRLTVEDVIILYMNQKPNSPLDFSYPYSMVKMKADLDGTNSAEFLLQSSILSTNLFKGQILK